MAWHPFIFFNLKVITIREGKTKGKTSYIVIIQALTNSHLIDVNSELRKLLGMK